MKLADLSTGPDWIVWVTLVILIVISGILLSGRGGWLIAGYNTAPKEEKQKYNEKKLCRTMGVGMTVISALLLVMGLFEDVLPAYFANVAIGIICADVLMVLIVSNVFCKKK